jgi:hypothetical protein
MHVMHQNQKLLVCYFLHHVVIFSDKPGDWFCVKCDSLNFKNRFTCFKCNADKYGVIRNNSSESTVSTTSTSSSSPKTAQEQWNCPNCNTQNYLTRGTCRKCSAQRPADAKSATIEVSTSKKQEKTPKQDCLICCEQKIEVALTVCGHYVMCNSCAEKIDYCPVCRKGYKPFHVLRIYTIDD